jgi:putative membrane protein
MKRATKAQGGIMRKGWIKAGLLTGLLSSGGLVVASSAPAHAEERHANGDREFVEQALRVNQVELQLGQLAAERASAPDVRAMGRKMVQNHTALGQQLKGLAREAGGSGSVELTAEERAIVERVAAQSGSAFDALFKQTVDAGHVKELAMYRDEVGRASSPKLRELATQRVTKLQETVAQADAAKAKTPPKQDW